MLAPPPATQKESDGELKAEVLVGLATDITVYSSRRGDALQVKKMIFTIRASDSSWHPGLPRRHLLAPPPAGDERSRETAGVRRSVGERVGQC